MPDFAGLLLVGDVDQLPPVRTNDHGKTTFLHWQIQPGNILRSAIDSETVPVVRLSEIHRQV